MGPFLTSAITTLAAGVLDATGLSSFLPGNKSLGSTSEPFDKHLTKAQNTTRVASPNLRDVLRDNHVQDIHNLKGLIRHTSEQLINHYELRSALDQARPSDALTLVKNEDNTFSIKTLNGNITTFGVDTQVGQLAEQLHQMQSTLTYKMQNPSQSLYEIAETITRQPSPKTSWELRPENAVIRRV